jgi:anti-sigma regulatory factor (Ser/Thr protein kinase)
MGPPVANEIAVTRAAARNMWWEWTYPEVLGALRDVRRAVRESLANCADALTDDVETVASELAANAVRHSRSDRADGTFTMRLAHFAERDVPYIWVEVEDMGNPEWDGICDLRPMHGFAMCQALTTWLGSKDKASGNRVVYARIEYKPNGMPFDLPVDPRLLADPNDL